jgi:hypothetical protein
MTPGDRGHSYPVRSDPQAVAKSVHAWPKRGRGADTRSIQRQMFLNRPEAKAA